MFVHIQTQINLIHIYSSDSVLISKKILQFEIDKYNLSVLQTMSTKSSEGGDFRLSCELTNHAGDVRSLGLSIGGDLLTGSRDNLLRRFSWKEENRAFVCVQEIVDHAHWVTCIAQIPPSAHPDCPDGGIVTGCQDRLLRIFNVSGKMVGTMTGHDGPISSVIWSKSRNQLVSASWDATVKVWNCSTGNVVDTLTGFENAVVLAELSNGNIATGSSGKVENGQHVGFTVRIFGSDLKLVQEVRDHSQRITDFTVVPGVGFASSSSDGTVRVRDETGSTVSVLGRADNNFVMSVACNPSNGEIYSVTDDGTLNIWSNGECIQQIFHPSSMWSVMVLPNGDVVTAGTDKTARVFTRDPSRSATNTAQKAFAKYVSEKRNKSSKSQSSQVNPSTLVSWDQCASHPGKKEGEVQMFNKNGKAFSYRWDASSRVWVELGEVVGCAGEVVDGVMYDKVLPIEIEDVQGGTGIRKLKIGFNEGDNPFVVAQQFCQKHHLVMDYTAQVAQYIQNNRGPAIPTIDMNSYAQKSGEMTVSQMLGGAGAPAGAASGASKSVSMDAFPPKTYQCFTSIKSLPKIAQKILEFNAQSESQLSPADELSFQNLLTVLSETSRYHSSTVTFDQVEVMRKLLHWPRTMLWPVVDFLRCAMLHEDFNSKLGGLIDGGDTVFIRSVAGALTNEVDAPTVPTIYLSLRYFCNLISKKSTRRALNSFCGEVLDCTARFLQHEHKHVRNGVASVLLGLSQIFHENGFTAPNDWPCSIIYLGVSCGNTFTVTFHI